MRLDGMASLHAERTNAAITTKLLVFQGDHLEVNISGQLTVEILDVAGKPLKGFEQADAIPFRGDQLRHRVEWRSGSAVAALLGQPVRLRFHLRNGDLYSYQFVETRSGGRQN